MAQSRGPSDGLKAGWGPAAGPQARLLIIHARRSSVKKKGSEPCDAPVMGKLMLENKLQMAAVVSTTTCFGLGARAAAEGAAMPRSVCSTTMLCS